MTPQGNIYMTREFKFFKRRGRRWEIVGVFTVQNGFRKGTHLHTLYLL